VRRCTRGDAPSISLTITYYVGHETVVPDEDEKGPCRDWWRHCSLSCNATSAHLTEYFKLPVEAVVEIGREVSDLNGPNFFRREERERRYGTSFYSLPREKRCMEGRDPVKVPAAGSQAQTTANFSSATGSELASAMTRPRQRRCCDVRSTSYALTPNYRKPFRLGAQRIQGRPESPTACGGTR